MKIILIHYLIWEWFLLQIMIIFILKFKITQKKAVNASKKAADRGNIIAMKYFVKCKMDEILPKKKNKLINYIYFVKLVNKCDDEFLKKKK